MVTPRFIGYVTPKQTGLPAIRRKIFHVSTKQDCYYLRKVHICVVKCNIGYEITVYALIIPSSAIKGFDEK